MISRYLFPQNSSNGHIIVYLYDNNHLITKPTKWHVRLAKTQISLGICPVWSESSLSAWRKLGSLAPIECTAKTLIRLGGCPGWTESLLGAQSRCRFFRAVAHMFNLNPSKYFKDFFSSNIYNYIFIMQHIYWTSFEWLSDIWFTWKGIRLLTWGDDLIVYLIDYLI